MATKKTSRKTAASTPEPRQKQNGNSKKATLAATTAAAAKSPKPAQAVAARAGTTARAAKSRTTSPAEKPAKSAKKVASLPRKNEDIVRKSAKDNSLAVEAGGIAPQPTGPSRHEIAARAAAIWRKKGGAPFDNWIQAERELGA